jgi:hypothetical protein
MSVMRNVLIVFGCGLFPVAVDAAFDKEWPDYGTTRWLVLLGGLVVFAVAFVVIDSLLAKGRAAASETDERVDESGAPTGARHRAVRNRYAAVTDTPERSLPTGRL